MFLLHDAFHTLACTVETYSLRVVSLDYTGNILRYTKFVEQRYNDNLTSETFYNAVVHACLPYYIVVSQLQPVVPYTFVRLSVQMFCSGWSTALYHVH